MVTPRKAVMTTLVFELRATSGVWETNPVSTGGRDTGGRQFFSTLGRVESQMNAILGTKPSAPVQVDFNKRRHQPEKDDLELSAASQALLASIEESARPKELATSFPRIVNRMA